jgi:hypothetical protein
MPYFSTYAFFYLCKRLGNPATTQNAVTVLLNKPFPMGTKQAETEGLNRKFSLMSHIWAQSNLLFNAANTLRMSSGLGLFQTPGRICCQGRAQSAANPFKSQRVSKFMSPVYSVNVKNTQKVGSEYVPHAISGT